jgi:hypothetical protein
MNDIDQGVRRQLRELIDPEPVDTDRALRFVRASGSAHREAPGRRIPSSRSPASSPSPFS